MSEPGGLPQFSPPRADVPPPPWAAAPPPLWAAAPPPWVTAPAPPEAAPRPAPYGGPAPYGASAPYGGPAPYGAPALPVHPRPPGVVLASTLAVTASLQWLCGLSFAWLVASLGAAELERGGETGPIFHIFNRFHYRMVDGLAWPLYLVPLASLVLGFLILVPRAWTRVAYTVAGAAALVGSAWLLRDALVWWLVPAAYIAVATGLVWTRAASAWVAHHRRPRTGGARPGQTGV